MENAKHNIAIAVLFPWALVAILLFYLFPYVAFILGLVTFGVCGGAYLAAIIFFSDVRDGRIVPLSNPLSVSLLYLAISGMLVASSVFAMWLFWSFTTR